MSRYFHDKTNRVLYKVDEPTVYTCRKPKSYSNPHPPIDCWSFSRKISIVPAENPTDPETGKPTYPEDRFIDEEYKARKYTEQQARQEFEQLFDPPGDEIDRETYEKLAEEYSAR